MPGKLGDFVTAGPAAAGRVRSAALVDGAAAFLLAVLAFPFPIARALLPLPVFVASIIGVIAVVHVAYVAITLMLWGRTPGMYLLDLGVSDARPAFPDAVRFAAGASCAFWPTVLRVETAFDAEDGWPARFSGLSVLAAHTQERR